MGLFSNSERFFSAHAPLIAEPSLTAHEYVPRNVDVENAAILRDTLPATIATHDWAKRLKLRSEAAANTAAVAE